MIRVFPYLTLLLTVVPTPLSHAGEVPLKLDPAGSNQVEIRETGDGGWEVKTTGTDPYFTIRTDGRPVDLHENPVLAFEYFSTGGVGRTLFFVGPAIDVPRMITVDLGRREAWSGFAVDMTSTLEAPPQPVTSLRMTLGQGPGIVARLRSFHARPATEEEMRLARGREERLLGDREHSARLRDYLAKDFPHGVDTVHADADKITIEGHLSEDAATSGEPLLAEIPMWEDITRLVKPAALHAVTADAGGRFSIQVSRKTDGREPLLSAWALVKRTGTGFELLSAARHVEKQLARTELPPAKPGSRKGIGGCPFDHLDMEALGISSVTLNIILNDLFLPDDGSQGPSHEFAGKRWQLNAERVADHDRQMMTAARHGWMVSAIILIRPAGNASKDEWIRQAAHPDADPGGIFVMPNFTSREGVNAYAAAMDFLAERYGRPDGRYGRVHHWIMHNEVNSGFFWNTAGNKTSTTYLDLYQKSLRIAWLLAGQYDSNAKPFISLEHCWTRKLDARAYAAKDLLEDLVSFSRKEGDFPWGIAFHPYAQEISNPRVWEDPDATFDFGTPFLTYRNIEVLDAWARQPRVSYRGQPREIQLTEQGINSPDYGVKTLEEQAASMVYVWKKIAPLETITAFQYHLWADDHGEGGLRLGLRKFGDDKDDPHGVKPIWHLYQALGTEKEDGASAFAKEVIGIRDWSEVPYRGIVTGK